MSNKASAKGAGKAKSGNKGHFKPGKSGNPHGRPRKPKESPKTLVELFAEAFSETVAVNCADGTNPVLTMSQLCVKQLVRALTKAKPKDVLYVLEKVQRLGSFDLICREAEDEDESEPIMSEEARRLLAITTREIEGWNEDDFEAGHVGADIAGLEARDAN